MNIENIMSLLAILFYFKVLAKKKSKEEMNIRMNIPIFSNPLFDYLFLY